MPEDVKLGSRALCDSCGASVQFTTYQQCSGICMRCFMAENDGYRPADLESLENRGLANFRTEWTGFKKEAFKANFSSLTYSQKQQLGESAGLIFEEVDVFLRLGKGNFKKYSDTTRLLSELESFESDTINDFIKRLREYYSVLQQRTGQTH